MWSVDFDDEETLWIEPNELAWQREHMRTVGVRLSADGLVGLWMCTLYSGGSKPRSSDSDGALSLKNGIPHRRPCKAPMEDLVVHNIMRGRNPFLDAVLADGHLGRGSVIK